MILTTIVIAVTLFVSTEDDTLTRVFINQQKETTVTNASDLENQFKTIQTTLRVISSRPNLLSMSTIQQMSSSTSTPSPPRLNPHTLFMEQKAF
jgi:hypothetical protein